MSWEFLGKLGFFGSRVMSRVKVVFAFIYFCSLGFFG
jgi:hypothetical protein